jgi:hypothetical protein
MDEGRVGRLGERRRVGDVGSRSNHPQVFCWDLSAAPTPAPIVTVGDFWKAPSRSAGQQEWRPGTWRGRSGVELRRLPGATGDDSRGWRGAA